jgi:lysozyme
MRWLVLLPLVAALTSTNVSEFESPWKDPRVPLIIDPYHANSIDWDRLATVPRVVAIIHKATIGTSRLDPAYVRRREEARRRGYLWGSYHWGVTGNPEKQADFYLDTVRPAADELIALDLEDARSRTLMDVDEAIRFVQQVKTRSGRYPVLYTNHASAKLISERFKHSVFQNTPLWYARFKAHVKDFPRGVWPTYTMWQFSSEILPQLQLAGTRRDMDINVFNGTTEQLRTAWPLTRVAR